MGAEMGACMADSTCSAEMNKEDDDDNDGFSTEAQYKAELKNAGPKFAKFMTCFWDGCVTDMLSEIADQVDPSVCALVATVAKNPTISSALEDAGADLSSIKEGAG